MIYTKCIEDICPKEYEEVWWIVRSPDSMPQKEKLVQSLAPSYALFRKYREAFKTGQFNPMFFREIYVPQFLEELSQNREAEKDLKYLYTEGKRKNIVIGCYCEEEKLCHRSIIAGILLGMGAQIETDPKYREYYFMFCRYNKCFHKTIGK